MERRWVIVVAVLAGFVAGGGIVAALLSGPRTSTGAAKTFIVAGTVRLTGQSGLVADQACAGTGGAADLHNGARVTVYGAGGQTLGVGDLVDGKGVADAGGTVSCLWDFFVSGVNANADTYFVEVTDRGRHLYDPSSIHGRVDLVIQAR